MFKRVTGVKALIGDLAGSLNNYSGKHSARKQKDSFRKVTCILYKLRVRFVKRQRNRPLCWPSIKGKIYVLVSSELSLKAAQGYE